MSEEKPDEKPDTNQGANTKEQAKFLRDTGLGNQYHGGRPFGK